MIVRERRSERVSHVARPERRGETGSYLWSSPAGRERGPNGAIVFLISVALIAAVGMLYLLQTNHIASLGYEMSRLQKEREAAMVEQQGLAAQIAARQAITEVGIVARRDLGMVEMENYVFLDVTFPEEPAAREDDPSQRDEPSVLERFWGRLTGKSSAGEDGR
ncbi:MAG TPA: hypothetical protein VKZ96_12700 [Thermomicrobiales bacterium]|nr:hypothetical protein [Thermomicrobiales bacterium]